MALVGIFSSFRNLSFPFYFENKNSRYVLLRKRLCSSFYYIYAHNNLDMDEAYASNETFRFMAKV
jgi:hypothetical protein